MTPTGAVGTLLDRLIDYAGLFPPAALDMTTAAGNYARYREGDHHWLLGRFIVPARRLGELEAALPASASGWRLSALVGSKPERDLDAVAAFNERHQGGATVDVIETMTVLPGSAWTRYVEIPLEPDPAAAIRDAAAGGARVKMRTGGVTVDAFPPASQVARFLHACHIAGARFKATAGLHHPVRCLRTLTYEPDSPSGLMHGFLNLFLAAALVRLGQPLEETVALLEEQAPAAFEFDEAGARWRGHRLSVDDLRIARAEFADSFGSCSFEEPIEDLRGLGLL